MSMSQTDLFATAVLLVVQGGLLLALAPLLTGLMKWLRARLQYRRGPSPLQPYRDLAKWWRKETVESDASSWVSELTPPVVMACLIAAILVLPLVAQRAPLAGWGDFLVVAGLLALARFALALGALDAGSAFGGMGSSRDVAIGTLIEPALLLSLTGAALAAGTTDLSAIAQHATGAGPAWISPALLLAAAAFCVAAVAETGHEPFDNPDTHLELTMVHEGMLLEASGRRLAMLSYGAQLKLVVVAGLFAAVFLPFGSATDLGPWNLLVGAALGLAKILAVAVGLSVLDGTLAKLRILVLPSVLGMASLLAGIGLGVQLVTR